MQPNEILSAMIQAGVTSLRRGNPSVILSDQQHIEIYKASLQTSEQEAAKTEDGFKFLSLGKPMIVKLDDTIKGMQFRDAQGKVLASV